MAITKVDSIKAPQSRCYIAAKLPTTAAAYYGTGIGDVDSVEFSGGELAYNTSDNRMYIQTATSGTTATWKRYLEAFAAA